MVNKLGGFRSTFFVLYSIKRKILNSRISNYSKFKVIIPSGFVIKKSITID